MLLLHSIYRRNADLSAMRWATCAYNTLHNAHISSDYGINLFRISHHSNLAGIRTWASILYSIYYEKCANVLPKKRNGNTIFL